MEHAGAGMCPSEPIDKSTPNRYRRTICVGIAALLLISVPAFATESPDLAGLSWLLGDWKGKGEGEPGQSTSERFFGVLFGLRYGLETPVAGSTLVVSTLASVVTVAVTMVVTAGW
jgi:hypothetical protein